MYNLLNNQSEDSGSIFCLLALYENNPPDLEIRKTVNKIKMIPNSIKPKTQDALLQVLFWGVRNIDFMSVNITISVVIGNYVLEAPPQGIPLVKRIRKNWINIQ